jgi:hypothetical protein
LWKNPWCKRAPYKKCHTSKKLSGRMLPTNKAVLKLAFTPSVKNTVQAYPNTPANPVPPVYDMERLVKRD